jgi:superfamily II DNA or RNA helicase
MARIRDNLVSIPVGRMDLIPSDYEVVDKRLIIPAELPEFKFQLRPSQKEVYNALCDNAIINAWVSWGKTITTLAIIGKLAQKTLVVTHTIALRNQWVRKIEEAYGITPGIIGSGKFELNNPICVGNTQTLYRNIEGIKKQFGTIVLDEMHHVSSPTFGKIIDTNYARYKIGLSGTIERKDKKHVVFRDYFSDNVFKPLKEHYMTPLIHIVTSGIRFLDGQKTPWANKVTHLANNGEYRHLVSMLAATYAAKGHKVLVVSDRVSFLRNCAELVGEKAVCVVGAVEAEERERLQQEIHSDKKQILFGTQAIYSEGISLDSLSCLILGTPINNDPLLTQLIGRVIREHPGKLQPIIVDIHLKGNTARRQASNRMAYYIRQGYKMVQL